MSVILVAGVVEAQNAAVRFNITKQRQTSAQRHSSYSLDDDSATTRLTRKVTGYVYRVMITNSGSRPLNDLMLKWFAVDNKNVLESEQDKLTLRVGQRVEMETSPVPASVTGFLIEVYDGDQLVASQAEPPQMRDQIRAIISKAPARKR